MSSKYIDGSELQRRLEQRRFEKRLREKANRKARNYRRSKGLPATHGGHAQYKHAKYQGNTLWTDLDVPKQLDLITNRDVTCEFFSMVRERMRMGQRVRLIFMDTQHVSPDALIFMLGQVHSIRLEFGAGRITGTYPKSTKIERLLEESGFFHVLNVKKRGVAQRQSRTTRYLKCKSDTKINPKEIPALRDELLGSDLRMPPPFGKKVFRALTEAMTNVNHHAYDQKRHRVKDLNGRWWLSAQLSVKNNQFTLTFYDAGVGIPKSLPRKHGWELIRLVLSVLPGIEPDDAQMIQAAIAIGRTRTGAENRGKGLMDLLNLINTVGGGSIWILSRYGQYQFGDCGESVSNHDGFVEGTLIKWAVPLDKALVSIPEAQNAELNI